MFVKSLSTEVNSMYFWSHYSYSHKGYCIEYEVDKSSFNKYFHPIEYSYGWPNDFLEFLNRSGANCAFSLVKSLDWKNEMEWRLIDALGKNDTRKDINFVKSDLKNGFSVSAIYLGLDFEKNEDSRKEKLINALQETDIKIFQMNIGDDDFKIGVGKQIK
jgi:hypothetical protein